MNQHRHRQRTIAGAFPLEYPLSGGARFAVEPTGRKHQLLGGPPVKAHDDDSIGLSNYRNEIKCLFI